MCYDRLHAVIGKRVHLKSFSSLDVISVRAGSKQRSLVSRVHFDALYTSGQGHVLSMRCLEILKQNIDCQVMGTGFVKCF